MARKLPLISRLAVREMPPPPPAGWGEAAFPPLSDGAGRRYSYLRLSVTDRCDLACLYCMPPGGEGEHGLRPELLSFEEGARLGAVFSAMGVRRIRLTGGEPLVRKDIVRLVDLLHRRAGVDELVMTTNATRLAELAEPLRRAGLRGVNISIDSLDAERFRAMTRGGDLARVLAGVHAALDVGMEVKLNSVLLRGSNAHEAEQLVRWAWSLGITPRFIELMPLGEGAKLGAERFVSAAQTRQLLSTVVGPPASHGAAGKGPARYAYATDGSGHKVGFITAVSEDFCGDCNRVRLTAQGDLRACLASRRAVSLRDLLRAGASDRELAWAVHWSLGTKDAGHHFTDGASDEHLRVGMSLIGG